jgi:hypothetical protein
MEVYTTGWFYFKEMMWRFCKNGHPIYIKLSSQIIDWSISSDELAGFGEPLARAKKPYHISILDSQERRMS